MAGLAADGAIVAIVLTATAVGGAGVLPPEVVAAGQRSQQRSTMDTYDDLLVRVEERVAGFGGMFIDSDGRLAVYLLDPARLAIARSAIDAVFGSSRIPAAGMRALQGQYTVSKLKVWTERASALLKMPRVVLVDLDEAKNRVTIGVDDASRTRDIERALSSLKVPREAVLIQVTAPIRPLDAR